MRLDEHLSSVRDLERAIASLPPEYRSNVTQAGRGFRPEGLAAHRQDPERLLAYALATGQTRVASYMLTKCQGLARFPWLGHTAARHHDYTHKDGKAPGEAAAKGQRILRDICRWHVEEFAYLVAKLKSIPEGDGSVLDNTVADVRARARRGRPAQEQRHDRAGRRQQEPVRTGASHADRRHDRRSLSHACRRRPGRRSGQDTDGQPKADRDPRLTTAGQNHDCRIGFLERVNAGLRNLSVLHIEVLQVLPIRDLRHGGIVDSATTFQGQLLNGRDRA